MPIHIPGVQHTKTVLALTAIEAAVEQILPFITDKKTTDQIAKVRKWVDQCSAATKVKRLSSGAKRDLESACSVLAPYIEDTAAVAPRAGAWIEGSQQLRTQTRHPSLPVRERGLKDRTCAYW